jgi:hypothetical protein
MLLLVLLRVLFRLFRQVLHSLLTGFYQPAVRIPVFLPSTRFRQLLMVTWRFVLGLVHRFPIPMVVEHGRRRIRV